jgi:Tfp pilus assembly protein PilE
VLLPTGALTPDNESNPKISLQIRFQSKVFGPPDINEFLCPSITEGLFTVLLKAVMLSKKHIYGFTVVELLVVIVTIVILATLSFVMYDGAVMKARNAQTADAVSKYLDVLEVYYTDHGNYPSRGSGTGGTCLGRSSYPAGNCWSGNATTDNTFMTTLETAAKSQLPEAAVSKTTGSLTGIWFSPLTAWVNGIDGHQAQFLVYMIEGNNVRCPVGPVASPDSNYNYTSTPPANGITRTGAGFSECWIPLPPDDM